MIFAFSSTDLIGVCLVAVEYALGSVVGLGSKSDHDTHSLVGKMDNRPINKDLN